LSPAIRVLAAAVALPLLAAGPTWIDQYAAESAAASKSCTAKQFEECLGHYTNLLGLLDGRADVVYRLAQVEASLGHRDASLSWLTRYSRSGLTFADPASDAAFASIREAPEFQAALARLTEARKPIDSSKAKFRIPESDMVAEDLAYDRKTERFFLSSVRYGKIVAIDREGSESDFLHEGKAGIWAVFALQADPKRRVLWATTGAVPEFMGYKTTDEGKSALLEFSMDSGKQLRRFDVTEPGKHLLGDMALAEDGSLFLSDASGAIYMLGPKSKALEVLIPPGRFRSPQTPAPAGNDRVFVPDYSRGISAVDLKTRGASLVPHPPELSLAGIDGLYLNGRTLIAVQNGTEPERIIAMTMDAGLTRIETWKTLAVNAPEANSPTHGMAMNGQFFYIAHSGWDRMGEDGKPKPGALFAAPEIRSIDLPGQR
jgi:hypothetical protein